VLEHHYTSYQIKTANTLDLSGYLTKCWSIVLSRFYTTGEFAMKKIFWMVCLFALVMAGLAPASVSAAPQKPRIAIVVDADTGVDDAAALAYLLNQPEADILGITAVAGNTSVEDAANNALILLEAAKRTEIPVVIGAAAPLSIPASRQGMFVHGPDGLWGLGYQNPHDLSGLSRDAVGFLCDKAQTGVTLLALGPLTNVAQAIQYCQDKMRLYNIVWLGGAKAVAGEGNTSVSVFNPWFDPDAADLVLRSGVQLTMVSTDAARSVELDPDVFTQLAKRGNTLGKLVAGPLQAYASVVQTTNRFGKPRVALFDPTAVVVVLHPDYITNQQSGLVVVDPAASFPTRGQTVVALSLQEKISTIADDAKLSALAAQAMSDPNFDIQAALGAILMSQPDNAQVVMKVNALKVKLSWLKALVF
jgi:inosine-uridine nucleoside N-ribohydrolase